MSSQPNSMPYAASPPQAGVTQVHPLPAHLAGQAPTGPSFSQSPPQGYLGEAPARPVATPADPVVPFPTPAQAPPQAPWQAGAAAPRLDQPYPAQQHQEQREREQQEPHLRLVHRALPYPRRDHPAIARLYALIDDSGDRGMSDIHVHAGKPIRRLLRGRMTVVEGRVGIVSPGELAAWLAHATTGAPEPFGDEGHCSPAVDTGRYRARGAFRQSLQGVTVSFRVIPRDVPMPDDVGVPAQIQALTTRQSGLVLVEGKTGSGKTTLNSSLINKVNHESDKHVYMLEDPIEFVHTEVGMSTIVQREIGVHARDYPSGIEDALRSKPDVIVVGEIRNPATAKAALHAATTGHLVLTTAHAGSIEEALDSFIGQFTADEQPQIRSRLAQSLLAIVVQQLVPTHEGKLTAAREVLINNQSFSELIREDQMHMVAAQVAGARDCFTMEDSLVGLVESGLISPDVARTYAKRPKQLEDNLARAGRK